MRVIKNIKFELYQCTISIIITDSVKEEASKVLKKTNSKEKFEIEAEGALVWNPDDISCYWLIIGKDYVTHDTIAHEVWHTVVSITKPRSIFEEEAHAWLCGHLTGTIYKFLESKKIKVLHA